MRSAALLMLAACTRTPPPAATTTPAATPPVAIAADAAPPSPPPAPAAPPAPPPLAIAAATLTPALPLATPGRVVLPRDAALHASAGDAAAHPPTTFAAGALVSVRLIAIGADTVEVETVGDPHDCVDGHDLGYRLRVHAPRAALVARVARPLSDAHVDGTGWLVQVGAPVRLFDDGSRVAAPWPVGAVATVPADALALAVAPSPTPAELPPVDAGRATCADPAAEARAAAERVEREAAERAVAEARAAEARARCEAAQADADAARARRKRPSPTEQELAALALTSCDGPLAPNTFTTIDLSPDGLFAAHEPRCMLRDGDAATLTIGGRAALSPTQVARSAYGILALADGYLVVAGDRCGEVRARVAARDIGPPGDAGATGSGGPRAPRLVARPGAKVTWPDGSAAGTADGSYVFLASDATKAGARLCITRPPIATPICHRAKDVRPAPSW